VTGVTDRGYGYCEARVEASYEVGVPVMQTLMIAGILLGVSASVACAAFLGFELSRLIELMF
jgi:hypothetical protein